MLTDFHRLPPVSEAVDGGLRSFYAAANLSKIKGVL